MVCCNDSWLYSEYELWPIYLATFDLENTNLDLKRVFSGADGPATVAGAGRLVVVGVWQAAQNDVSWRVKLRVTGKQMQLEWKIYIAGIKNYYIYLLTE